MTSWIVASLLVAAVLAAAVVVAGWKAWKAFGGPTATRRARLLVKEQTAGSAPHVAVIRWRRVLDDALDSTRRAMEVGRSADAPMADLPMLFRQLERSVAALDQELMLLAAERDPARVDYVLRTDVGVRADRALLVAGELRRAVTGSLANGNAAALGDVASSTGLTTRALSAALEELSPHRDPL